MKLIKIKEDHYVVVDDSKIEVGDWYIDDAKQIRQSVVSDEVYWQHRPYNREYMKITHSTEPLEDRDNSVITIKPVKSAKAFYFINPLSLQEVKELIGEVDVDKRIYDTDFRGDVNSYKNGYNQSLEDNKEKKYTEEDMRKAFEYGKTLDGYDWFGDLLESLQPKTEWEVCFVDGKLKLK